MPLTVTHSTVVSVADDGTSPVGTDEWNAAHSVTGTINLATQFPAGGEGQMLLTKNGVAVWDFREQWAALINPYTLANVATEQKLFNVPANGSVSVLGNRTYWFECSFTLSAMSATSGNVIFDILGAGTAVITSAALTAIGADTSTPATSSAVSGLANPAAQTTGSIVLAAIGTGMFVVIRGIIRTGTGSGFTLVPSVTLANAAAAVVAANSYFRIVPAGADTDTAVGFWT